jgi:hypothetical protein
MGRRHSWEAIPGLEASIIGASGTEFNLIFSHCSETGTVLA